VSSPRFVLAAIAVVGVALAGLVLGDQTSAQTDEGRFEPGSPEAGQVLYEANCITCHGADGGGVDGWPSIRGSGAAAADFQLRTGRMPYTQERGEQALRKPPAYDEEQIRDLVAYVATLGDGPEIPRVTVDDDLLSRGLDLFSANCAPCHGATGRGGAVGGGAIAWALTDADPITVAEAMITGPGQMPVFDLPQEDRDAIITYSEYLRTAASPGGFEIGGIGPVPEGFVAWLVGMGLLALIVVLVGRQWAEKPR
jgi:ubiquinol-cytochrome c reductase cytochrome c subunit